MLKNYIKIAIRSLWRNKFEGIINLTGLTIGLVGCMLIGLFIWDELQFDLFHRDADRIYRLVEERIDNQGSAMMAMVPPPMGPAMQEDFPEVEDALRIFNVYDKPLFRVGDKEYLEEKGIFSEVDIFDYFDLAVLEGDPETALAEPNTMVITERLAKKYFGNDRAVGSSVSVDGDEVEVTGVIADLPDHFHLDFDFIFSFETFVGHVSEERMGSWIWQNFFTYLRLAPGTDPEALAGKFPAFLDRYDTPVIEENGFTYRPVLQALPDVHLHSSGFKWDIARRGNIAHVRALAVTGLLLLLIAVINFVNLSTARAERRAKEVGVRKVTGASRAQLVWQFTGEAVMLALAATVVASQVVRLLLPYFNDFTGKTMSMGGELFWPGVSLLAAGGILVGVLAGIYPAFVISAFRPVKVLKGMKVMRTGSGAWLRKALVVVQFALSVMLIIGSWVILQQINFLNSTDMGFQREHVLTFPMEGKIEENPEAAKEEFVRHPDVISATAGYGFPGDMVAGDDIMKDGKAYPANLFCIDHDYIRTMGMEIITGRDFDKNKPTDANEAFIINETAVRELGFESSEEAVGKELDWKMWTDVDTVKNGKIIGVVRDFHFKSLHEKVGAAVLHIYPDAYWKMAVRISGGQVSETMAFIQSTWDGFNVGYPLDYQFIDESFDEMYRAEEKLGTLLGIFTILTIFVACIGLLGLVSFTAQQRTKEIGIRKVLGASVKNIAALLAADFMKLVLLAVIIAVPVGWYLLSNWLSNFSYHIDISPWMFVLAGGAAMLIALITVSYHSIRAALSNPVNALRYE